MREKRQKKARMQKGEVSNLQPAICNAEIVKYVTRHNQERRPRQNETAREQGLGPVVRKPIDLITGLG